MFVEILPLVFFFFLPPPPLQELNGGRAENIHPLLSSDGHAEEKPIFPSLLPHGEKCKTLDSSPCSRRVVIFSWTIFRKIHVLVLLFAVEKSVPSPACGWAFIGEVTLMSMQALFYQLTSLRHVVLWILM